MIHDIAFIEFYENDNQRGFEESTIVGLEQAVPWESRHVPIISQEQLIEALNGAINRHEMEMKYLTGLRLISHHVDFKQLRTDATERGSLTALVNEFWEGYDED